MKHIASCSFGKDSLAAIITRMEHGEPVDGAIYCRIMFDSETSAELPEHEEWIYAHAMPLLKSRYGIETAVVQSDRTYVEQFYAKFQKGEKVGQIYGFPLLRGPWCNDRLKIKPIKAYQKRIGAHKSIVGIADDEPERKEKKTVDGKILPLVDHNIVEADTYGICRKADLLSPAYNNGRERLGCWFCHNQRVGEMKRLRKECPELWRKLMALDCDSPCTFKPGKTLADYEDRFSAEDAQVSLFDKEALQ